VIALRIPALDRLTHSPPDSPARPQGGRLIINGWTPQMSTGAALGRHHHSGQAMPWADARALAHRLPVPLGVQDVPLAQAAGRTLGVALHAATSLPGFDNAAMDGYAVRGSGPWRLVGGVLAGGFPLVELAHGEAMEIATGAPMPRFADRVVEYEVTNRCGSIVSASPGPRRHIRRAGEYVKPGQELLPAGHVLTAAALGLAASVGVDVVRARTRPTVRVLVTGDELVMSGVPPYGKVRDAIGPAIVALLDGWDVEHPLLRRVPDDPADALTTAISTSVTDADVTIVCGSCSVGPADGLHRAIDAIGATVHIDGVACRPGHPQVLAQAGSHWLIGIPGNPFAALVAAVTLLQPLLAGLAGRLLPELPGLPLRGEVRPVAGFTRLVPVRWHQREAHVINGAHPSYLGPAAQADALAAVTSTWQPGEVVDLVPIPA
jgi:molybdopterin molybdotransferase